MTLTLIADGGPYPFSRDDAVFQNRERLLPIRDNGHYREYTVVTPGEDDRGARRIVAARLGFREWFGRNWDALNDALFDRFPASSGEPAELIVRLLRDRRRVGGGRIPTAATAGSPG